MDSVKEQVAYIPLQGSDHDEESDAGTLVLSVKPARFRRPRRGLCTLYVTVALLLGLLLGGSTSTGKDTRKVVAAWISRDRTLDNDLDSLYGYDGLGDVADISRWVAGTNATNTFRENLLPHVKYLTTWNSAGMTNVFQGYCNMIYVAMLSERVAVVPPLAPSPRHLGPSTPLPFMNFGEVFDLPRLSRAIRVPVIEWKDVKKAHYDVPWSHEMPPVEGAEVDELGCWSKVQVVRGASPHRTDLEDFLQLDVAYTPVPLDTLIPNSHDQVSFWALTYLLFQEGRETAFVKPGVKPGITKHSKRPIEPDDHFACFDDLHFAAAIRDYEWERDHSPAWRFVGTHVHFTEDVDDMALEFLRRILDVPDSQKVPPYIAVHIRRDDWDEFCFKEHKGDGTECFPPLSAFDARIRQVQTELQERFGAVTALGNVRDVIVTSDETNATWWQDVRRRGWIGVDHGHERTAELYGRWWPAILDSVIHSKAIGFVGTKRSSMSRVSGLRVRDWNGGVTRMVSWSNGQGARR